MKQLLKAVGASTLVLTLAFSQFACGGSGSSGEAVYKEYNTRVAMIGAGKFERLSREVLDRHQYRIVRSESSQDQLYLETDWRPRYPLDDETGVVAGRSRIILQARPKDFSASGQERVFRVRLTGQSMVQLNATDGFVRRPMSEQLKKHFAKVARDLKLEYDTNIYR